MKKALLYLFIFVAVQSITMLVFSVVGRLPGMDEFAGIDGQRPPGFIILMSIVYGLILTVIFLHPRFCPVEIKMPRKATVSVIMLSVLAMTATIIPSLHLQHLLNGLFDTESSSQLLEGIMENPWSFVSICLLAPLTEELVFRGAILTALRKSRCRPWFAIIMSALFFGIIHINPSQIPHSFLMGLLLGWIYVRTCSLIPCILAHMANNTVVYMLVWLLPESTSDSLDWLGNTSQQLVGFTLSATLLTWCVWLIAVRTRPINQQADT